MKADHLHRQYRQESYFWWHLGRRQAILALINQHFPPRSSVLDVGCGTGRFLTELSSQYSAYGVDIDPIAVNYARKNSPSPIKQADISQSIPFRRKFSAITAMDILEHINNDTKALQRIFASLKPKGLLFITVPAYPYLCSYWDQSLHHFRRYSQKQLTQKLLQAGFTIKHISFFNTLLFLPLVIIRKIKSALSIKNINQTDFHEVLPPINWVLTLLLRLEIQLSQKIKLPFGLSLLAIAQKP